MRQARAVAALVGVLLLPATVAPVEGAVKGDEVRLRFDGGRNKLGDPLTAFRSDGEATVRVRTLSEDGGEILRARGVRSPGVRFPGVSRGSPGPRALIRVHNTGRADHLEPRTSRFRFGADVKLNAVSSSASDTGDNVIQRGLWESRAQYKLQVDKRLPTCVVTGKVGSRERRVVVSARRLIQREHWYRVGCLREGRLLRLSVRRYLGHGDWARPRVSSVRVRSGDLDFPRATPLSVGGKLRSKDTLVGDIDQFNGVIDNAFLQIG